MKKIFLLITLMLFVSTKHVGATSLGYGIPKTNNGVTPYPGDQIHNLINEYNHHYIGDTTKKEIYLTFDTGYELGNTSVILDTLKKTKTKAAFFVTGHFLEENEELIKRMHSDGHLVVNHTWSHPDITTISKEDLYKELNRVEKKFEELTGSKMKKYLRPPKGMLSTESLKYLQEFNYQAVYWSLAFVDWEVKNQKGWRYSYDNVISRIHNGAIILLHTVSTDNRDALLNIITDLNAKGYKFKTLENLKSVD